MKKVFDRVIKVRFNGNDEWYDTSIFSHLVYEREEFNGQKFDYHFDNFQEAFNWIEQGYLRNAETTETLFKHRPQIHISTAPHNHCHHSHCRQASVACVWLGSCLPPLG